MTEKIRLFTAIFLFLVSFFWNSSFLLAQERKPISLKEFSYIYAGSGFYDQKNRNDWFSNRPRIIYALNDSMVLLMSESLENAINAYWDADISQLLLIVEGFDGFMREFPKWKPGVPKRSSNNWEVFLRILDRGNGGDGRYIANLFIFECKVFDGQTGGEVFSRKMDVHFYREEPPEGQYLLTSLPGMPAAFLKAFDQAAKSFFSASAPEMLKLEIKPACLFIDRVTAANIRQTIRFKYSMEKLYVEDGPNLAWIPQPIEQQKAGKTKRKGFGIGSGLIALAGLDNEKDRTETTDYLTRVRMTDETTGVDYAFHIPTREMSTESVSTARVKNSDGTRSVETASGPTSFSRMVLPGSFITRGNDTIGNFDFLDKPTPATSDNLNYFWDGRDSATITPMFNSWNIQGSYPLFAMQGNLYGKSFLFTNHKAGNQLDVWYDEQHVASLKVDRGRPTDGILYESDAPQEVLKVLAMFGSLPYRYYGKSLEE